MTSTSKRWRSGPLVFLLSLLLTLVIGCKKRVDDAPEVLVTVQAAHPTEGAISEDIAADAILAPISVAALSPRISAPIRAEYVQRGTHVKRGRLLVSLDDRDLKGNAQDRHRRAHQRTGPTTRPPRKRRSRKRRERRNSTSRSIRPLWTSRRARHGSGRLIYKQGALSGREADAAHAAEVQAQAAL